MNEVLGLATHLPDDLRRGPATGPPIVKHCLLKPPSFLVRIKFGFARGMERVHQFAEHVDLHLVVGAVAYAHGLVFS